MANQVTTNPFAIDTAAGTTIYATRLKVLHFEFVEYSGPSDTVVVTNVQGNTVWSAKGNSDQTPVKSFKIGWINGLIVPTLDSGRLLVHFA